jgi:hypothetical protein
MKKEKKFWMLIIICALLIPRVASGQSESNVLLDKCASSLGTYNYIKSFNINFSPWKKANSEFSYVFSKGSTYILIVCNENTSGGKLILSLYDRNHNFIASTYDEKSMKHYPELLYPCSATGVYYIKASFEGTRRGHGLCILGFKNNQEE